MKARRPPLRLLAGEGLGGSHARGLAALWLVDEASFATPELERTAARALDAAQGARREIEARLAAALDPLAARRRSPRRGSPSAPEDASLVQGGTTHVR